MSLSFDADQRAFRESVRGALDRSASAEHTRDFIEGRGSVPFEVWRSLNESLGLTGLPLAEDRGGQGASWSEVGIVFEELGRTLYPTPYLSIMTAIRALMGCPTSEARRYLESFAAGAASPLVAIDGGEFTSGAAATCKAGDTTIVMGASGLVPFHPNADVVLLVASSGSTETLVALPTSAARVDVVPTIDLTRPMCTIAVDAAPGVVLSGPAADTAIADGRALIATTVALEAVGGADICLSTTVDYARDRQQFGAAIGSFQGVKHRLADLLRSFEPAKSAAYAALEAANSATPREFAQTASIAKLVADQMYADVSVDSVQLHGGIGFTWELDLHLHYKRAVANRAIGASTKEHRRAVKSMIRELLQNRVTVGVSV